MPYVSRIPEIASAQSLGLERAVHEAGDQVEFLIAQREGMRRRTGREQQGVRVVPNRRDPHKLEVYGGAFYTLFSEYGTVHQTARPVLGPSADEAEPAFYAQAGAALLRAV